MAPPSDTKTNPGESEPEKPPTRLPPALALPADAASERKLEAVHDHIKQESWAEATRLLQALLDGPDVFLSPKQSAPDGEESIRWMTLRAEAHRLLGTLPAAGREFYEVLQGERAQTLLAEALDKRNPQLLAEVSQRFLHTKAGAEATRLLGAYHLDRGRSVIASLCFEQLLSQPDAEKMAPVVWFSAALAFQRAGDRTLRDQAWKKLTALAPKGLRFGNTTLSLAELQTWLGEDRPSSAQRSASSEWPLFRGNASRSARGLDSAPALEATWQHATAYETATRNWVQAAVQRQEARDLPVLPAFFPLAARGKIIYRSHRGIHAVDGRTGAQAWESELDGSLDTLGSDLSHFPYVESWVNAHLKSNPHVLFDNAVLGTLSTDGQRVYAVDDLAVPPYQNIYSYRGRPAAVLEYTFTPPLTEATHHSRLLALDLESGKLLWERGEPGAKQKDELYPSHFLGPPLPLEGKLYALIEKNQELHLVCLDAAGGELLWKLGLGLAPVKLLADAGRRLQAVHLAHVEGVLVCPTNTGFLVAVDPLARRFLWASSYREPVPATESDVPIGGRGRGRSSPTPMPPPNLRADWTASAPILHDGKVIFTAPDSPSVYCLSLRDGSLVWKVKRTDDDLYLAGVSHGKVLVAGKQACRALNLADGKPLWEVETGLPSGLGAAGDDVYYLPLKAATKNKQPAVYVIDLDNGRVRERIASPQKEAPGNLLFHEGIVISQTATVISAYPKQRKP